MNAKGGLNFKTLPQILLHSQMEDWLQFQEIFLEITLGLCDSHNLNAGASAGPENLAHRQIFCLRNGYLVRSYYKGLNVKNLIALIHYFNGG
ncbi:unnamed protein product [Bathycoccus prasinos]